MYSNTRGPTHLVNEGRVSDHHGIEARRSVAIQPGAAHSLLSVDTIRPAHDAISVLQPHSEEREGTELKGKIFGDRKCCKIRAKVFLKLALAGI